MNKTIIIPVSGGKDSQACLRWAIEKHGARGLRVVHQNTGYDHPDTYAHLEYMAERYGVTIEHTVSRHKDVFSLIENNGYFPNNSARVCTEELKQKPFGEWLIAQGLTADHIYMGMRTGESTKRAKAYADLSPDDIFTLPEIAHAYPRGKFKGVTVSLPIVNMTTPAVFKYLAKHGDKVNPLYARGHDRVGCYPCLLSGQKEWVLAVRDPVGIQHIDRLLGIQREFIKSPTGHKAIRIHETRNVETLRRTGNFAGDPDLMGDTEGCAWCSQ